MPNINIFLILFTLSFSSIAMHHDQRSAIELINMHLVKHSELYDFDSQIKDYWNEQGAEFRWETLAIRKLTIIQEELINPIEEQLRNFEAFVLKRYNILNKTVRAIQNPIDALDNYSSAEYDKMILACKNARHEIREALKADPISIFERSIIKAPGLKPEMLRELSRSLFSLRNSSGKEALNAKDRIECAITVPTKFKRLPPNATPENFGFQSKGQAGKMKEFLDAIFKDSKLKIYSDSTKEALRSAITAICTRSQLENIPEKAGTIEGKQIFLFYGEPGSGKSFAAQEIAKELGLPVHIIPALREEDFGHGKITGNSEWTDDRLGKLFEAFYIQSKQDNSCWKNPVIIIDEVDRMMGKHNNMLKPLMDLFDDNIKYFHSNYLGADIDISGIIFILTANSDFGLGDANHVPAEFSNAKDKFAALRDRMEMIYFSPLPQAQVKDFLRQFIKNNMLFNFSTCFSADHNEELTNELVEFISLNFKNNSIRKIEKIAKKLANISRDQWELMLPLKTQKSILPEIIEESRKCQYNNDIKLLNKKHAALIDELEIVYDEYDKYLQKTKRRDHEILSQITRLEEELANLEEEIAVLNSKKTKFN